MQFAIVDGVRSEPFPKGRGLCPICYAAAVAKCGPRVMHHWAHARNSACDPWWENETEWHRSWKNEFPVTCREVAYSSQTGEVHRADIVTPTGVVVEIQNSPISDQERQSREDFYGNMLWIVNGQRFKDRFHILSALPDLSWPLASDLVWYPDRLGGHDPIFWRKSKNPEALSGRTNMVELENARRSGLDIVYGLHRQYFWQRPHIGWLNATKPVYLDFGTDLLWRLETYSEFGPRCVFPVARAELIREAMRRERAEDICPRTKGPKHVQLGLF